MINLSHILSSSFDLIVLNRPGLASLYQKLYLNSTQKIITDGSALRLKQELGPKFQEFPPDLIVGDFDSLEQTDEFLNLRCVKINDQNNTDLDKALGLTCNNTVVILTDFWGRLDHTLGAFNSVASEKFLSKSIFFLSQQNLAFFVKDSVIVKAQDWKYCGIFPLFGRTVISTSGFNWDMKNKEICFGGFISFCNELRGEGSISVDKPVLLVFSNDSS